MQDSGKGNKVFLMVAVGLGVLAMVLAYGYINQQNPQDNRPPVRVVVATRDLLPGKAIDPERDFKIEEIPAKYKVLADRGLPVDAIGAYKGQKVNRRVLAETPVMLADFTATVDIELKPGCVGVSLPVRGANALSGLLVPGDYVKVLVTRPLRMSPTMAAGTPTQEWETVAVVDVPLKVVAVGARLSRMRQQLSSLDQVEATRESEQQNAVTLEVTEEQAKAILAKTGSGQLPVTLLLATTVGAGGAVAGSQPAVRK